MSEEFNKLMHSFDEAIQKKEKGKITQPDVDKIYQAAHDFFHDDRSVEDSELNKIRDKWIALAEGKIDRGRAMKKLKGTSRAEAIKSVLQSLI